MGTLDDLADLQQQLRDLDTAIKAARTGSSYSIGGRTLTRQDLGELDNERTRLVRRIRQTEAVLEGAREPGVAIASIR